MDATPVRPRAQTGRPGAAVGASLAFVAALMILVGVAAADPQHPPAPHEEPDDRSAATWSISDAPEASHPTTEQSEQQQGLGGVAALTANPLYTTDRLAPLPCPAPGFDVHDPDAMEDFLHRITDCLDQVWSTQFERAGMAFTPPERVYWREPGTSPCRDYPSAAGAFYCRTNTGIHIGVQDAVRKWNGETNTVVYASLLAHEYGHHVQSEAGILEYYHDRRAEEEDVAERNAWTRRSELQADCLAGAFLGAVLVSYPLAEDDHRVLLADAEATADLEGEEDERTHGSPENSRYWTQRGLQEQNPGACNTWEADDALVE